MRSALPWTYVILALKIGSPFVSSSCSTWASSWIMSRVIVMYLQKTFLQITCIFIFGNNLYFCFHYFMVSTMTESLSVCNTREHRGLIFFQDLKYKRYVKWLCVYTIPITCVLCVHALALKWPHGPVILAEIEKTNALLSTKYFWKDLSTVFTRT